MPYTCTVVCLYQADRLVKPPQPTAHAGAPPLQITNADHPRTASAFCLSQQCSGSWRLPTPADPDVPLAHAVIASAAEPLTRPAMDEVLAFNKKDRARRFRRSKVVGAHVGLTPRRYQSDTVDYDGRNSKFSDPEALELVA